MDGQAASRLRNIIHIFYLETVLRWHRELVQKKWNYPHKDKGGRPLIDQELERLILRPAKENPAGDTKYRTLHPDFFSSWGSIGWCHLMLSMSHCKEQILAADFFTVETIKM
jgi:hypothetical protein